MSKQVKQEQVNILLNEATAFLRKVPPFQFLDEDDIHMVARNLSLEFHSRNTLILKQDGPPSDALRIIKKGGVKVSMTSKDGEEVVIDYRGEGDTFGFLSLVGKDRVRSNVTAVDDTVCYLLGKELLLKLLDSHLSFTEYFLKTHITRYIDKTYKEMQKKSMLYGGSDRLLFTTRVGDMAVKKVISTGEDASIRDAARIMSERRISSLVIMNANGLPAGIITDRDLRDKVVAKGRSNDEPVKNIMSTMLIRVDAQEYCFEAVLRMIKYNIHHVLVIGDGVLIGVLTNHDLMMLQGTSPLSLTKDIEAQHTIEGLVPVSKKINNIVGLLLKEGARSGAITRIIAELNDRLVRKVLDMAEKKFGRPPAPYCWLSFGSEGRREQTFKTDQDNALLFADQETPEKEEAVRRYFSLFTVFVRDSLVQCGFPLCPADYMASNARWCQPLSVWKKYFSTWINRPTPEAVLRSLIFFDIRPLYGDEALAAELRAHLAASLKGRNLFLAQMASAITKNRPPLGFFRTFLVEKDGAHKDELNLKIRGIGPLVDIVRLFSLESGVAETSTLDRIAAMKGKHATIDSLGEELAHAFEFITLLRIHHQAGQMERGQAPDNFINPSALSNLEKNILKESFHVISKVQDGIISQYGPGMVGG